MRICWSGPPSRHSAPTGGCSTASPRLHLGRSGWPDTIAGVLLGVVLGIAVVTAFVFLGSETTIDAPRISGVDTGKQRKGGAGTPPPVVRVIGGAPPSSGPTPLGFSQGATVGFTVDSDTA